jgi:DNA-binding MarR family transcriptional regulator
MNVKHVVDELQRRSLLASATEPGTRRTRKLYLSEEGERLADRVNERIRAQEDWFDQVLGTSGSEQLRLLVSALELALGVTERDGDRNLRP